MNNLPFTYRIFTTRYKKYGLLFIFAILIVNLSPAQVQKNGSLTGYVYLIIDNLPVAGSEDYAPPLTSLYDQWEILTGTLLEGNFATAATQADALDYELIEFTDGQSKYYILEKKLTGNNFWGTYIFNPEACRKVVVQCPHPSYDYNTGKEGIYVFQQSDAFFYFVSGTHRCNSGSYSPCSGTTTVCTGSSESYRISDPAHNTNSIFQATSEALKAYDSTLVFIQLHGFTKHTTDPYVIMSNGTRDTPSPDYIAILKNELAAVDPVLDFKIGHIDLDWNRLLAFTNVQGRFLNESSNPCTTDAVNSSGTFIHIEQEKTRLRADSTKWEKMAQAVTNTFTCQPLHTGHHFSKNEIRVYPNPTTGKVTVDMQQSYETITLKLFSPTGELVMQKQFIQEEHPEIILTGTPGIYFLEIIGGDGKSSWVKIVRK
ncbi:MAG: T9SS type A sorting domain-containing protein [Chlorobi bacterium]|nr:T9SS type A sorting domain-containing protein [Chlorobiota bacterium]